MVCLCQQAACTCLRLSRASASPVQHPSEGSTASPALAVALKDWCFKCTLPCRPRSSRAWLVPGCGGSDVALPRQWQVPLSRSVGQVGICSRFGSFTSSLRGHFTEDGLLLTDSPRYAKTFEPIASAHREVQAAAEGTGSRDLGLNVVDGVRYPGSICFNVKQFHASGASRVSFLDALPPVLAKWQPSKRRPCSQGLSKTRVTGRHGNLAVALIAMVMDQVHEQVLTRLPFQAPGPTRVSRVSHRRASASSLSCRRWQHFPGTVSSH